MSGLADLHIHTNNSDGHFTPEEIVEKAVAAGLRAISITDHDDISGVIPAKKAAAAYNLEVIPGIELSTTDDDKSWHLLGYFIDIQNVTLQGFIEVLQRDRMNRAKRIIEKLEALGISIHLDVVLAKAGSGAVGRPHIAEVLLEDGFVLSFDEAFYKYLGDGKPAFVPNYAISCEDAIKLIHETGGLAFIAHPGSGISGRQLDRMVTFGLDGIEILHPRFRESEVGKLYNLAVSHNLLVSGGSDCHGDRNGACPLGTFNVPYRFVLDMKERIGQATGQGLRYH